MCTVGDLGGQVLGPRLKEMAHLAHTEYELRGRTSLDVREVLRETMFAATVTGSPVQNATRVIRRYEGSGRGYYSGALALIGRSASGGQQLDSPICIRTADIEPRTGRLVVRVGATLVRHSDPYAEVAEHPCQGRRGAGRDRRPPAGRAALGARRGPAAGRRPPGAGGAGRPPERPGAVLAADAAAGPRRAGGGHPGGGRRGHLHLDAGPPADLAGPPGHRAALRHPRAARAGGRAHRPAGARPRPGRSRPPATPRWRCCGRSPRTRWRPSAR